ncbi:unnamed protein product [Rhizophagus irregularis]|nr:unnamed protein product [Rhizophagus irregularis]
MEELFKYFYESLLDEPKTVKNGSYITLKHVATGKYLSICDDTYDKYEGGSVYLVYAGPTVPDTNLFTLTNKNTKYYLCVNGGYESPATKNLIVYGSYSGTLWHFKSTNSENPPYMKSKDIINLQSDQFVLRSSESTFTNRSITYQEVACHKERIGGNDEWCIEIIEQSN